MPSKKKKYNTRFPASRIKKIMQTDEEIGKVAQAVPIIISRTLELFVESLLKQSKQITQSRNAKTLTPSHMKQCILSESRFDFLKDLVKNVPDASVQEDNENNAMENEALDYSIVKEDPTPETPIDFTIEPKYDLAANYYTEQSTSNIRTPVIQFNAKHTNHSEKLNSPVVNKPSSRVTSTITSEDSSKFNFPSDSRFPLPPSIGGDTSASSSAQSTPTGDKINFQYSGDHKKLNFSIESLVNSSSSSSSNEQPKLHLDFSKLSSNLTPPSSNSNMSPTTNHITRVNDRTQMPPLIPITQHYAAQSSGDNLYIDEDYDN